MTPLRLSLIPLSLYATVVGVAALLAPGPLNDILGYSIAPSCHPWIQLVGCLALPLGLGLFVAHRDPRRNFTLLQATLVLALVQLPLDVSFLAAGTFSFRQIGLDLVVLAGTAIAIVWLYPERGGLVRLHGPAPLRPSAAAGHMLRLALGASFGYLLLGCVLSIFLPRLMNDLLRYTITESCVPWVQYTGPLDLALGVAFFLAMKDAVRDSAVITVVGIPLSALVIALELYLVWQGTLELWQATDVPVAAFALLAFVVAHPSRLATHRRAAAPS